MEFNFYNQHDELQFNGKLKSGQCQYSDDNSHRCPRICYIPIEYYNEHLPIALHIEVNDSTIENAGKGLFAKYDRSSSSSSSRLRQNLSYVVFRKDQRICEYKGEIISNKELQRRYGNLTGPYAVEIDNGAIDSAIIRGVGSIANTHSAANKNALLEITDNNKVFLVATKNIKNKEEIFLDYGPTYKINEGRYETIHIASSSSSSSNNNKNNNKKNAIVIDLTLREDDEDKHKNKKLKTANREVIDLTGGDISNNNNIYCGCKDKIPKGKKRGNMKECAAIGQVRLYGIKKLDPILIKWAEDIKKICKTDKREKETLQEKYIKLSGKIKKLQTDIDYINDKSEVLKTKKKIQTLEEQRKEVKNTIANLIKKR